MFRNRWALVSLQMALSSQIRRMAGLSTGVVLLALSAGCSTAAKRPVFYPNSHIQQVGQAQARRDTDQCMALADEYEVSRTKDGEAATRSVEGALIGGVSAGAWGIVRGRIRTPTASRMTGTPGSTA